MAWRLKARKDAMDVRRKDNEGEERRPEEPAGEAPAAPDVDARIGELKAQVADLNARYLRAAADCQNIARRSLRDAEEARHQGAKSVVLNVLTVLDHFDLALAQDPATATAEQIVSGVRVIRDELMKVLQNHGVELIAAEPNSEFDPNRHQAVTQASAPGIEPGRIVATLKPGYSLGDRVIRPAMVSVAPTENA
jgi:molecular chaperone GrpE